MDQLSVHGQGYALFVTLCIICVTSPVILYLCQGIVNLFFAGAEVRYVDDDHSDEITDVRNEIQNTRTVIGDTKKKDLVHGIRDAGDSIPPTIHREIQNRVLVKNAQCAAFQEELRIIRGLPPEHVRRNGWCEDCVPDSPPSIPVILLSPKKDS